MTILFALLIDLLFGEPPNRWHPVAWLGRLLAAAKRRAPESDAARLRYGAGMLMLGASGAATLGCLAERVARRSLLGWLLQALLLKLGLSWRNLANAARAVESALQADDLHAARHLLGWHLVSRDTSQLDSGQIAGAAIESVAENLSDSLIAPLMYYSIGGLPALWAYRLVNTADAMLGYRDAEHAHLGRVAARMDDMLNFIPARASALALIVAARLTGTEWRRAQQTALRDHVQTDSPNAGWPMSAMAGALGVSLAKTGHYRLGDGPAPRPADISRALRVAGVAATLMAGSSMLIRHFAKARTIT